MKKNNIVRIIILTVVFPLIIQGLFCLHPKNPIFIANWTAGEILTYMGTVFLGVVAVIQNENATKLAMKSNELSIWARRIDYELGKKNNIEKRLAEFEEIACPHEFVTTIREDKSLDIALLIDKESDFKLKCLNLCCALGIKLDDDTNHDETGLLMEIKRLHDSTLALCTVIKKEYDIAKGKEVDLKKISNAVEIMKKNRVNMDICINKYTISKRKQLDEIISSIDIDVKLLKNIY